MPQHHPEDRVRVRNIIAPKGDEIQTFFLTRLRKERVLDANGIPVSREVPYEKEIEWNFKEGFFFMWGGRAYILKPGEEKTYPRFIAEHCAKNMVQHELNNMYQATKRISSEGIPMYDRNILNNHSLKNQIRDKIIVGVEEWYEASDDDFDSLIAKKFGGDVESYLNDERVSKDDYELPAIDDYEEKPLEVKPVKARKASGDREVEKLRDECDASSVEWSESDSASELKARLLNAMA